jgi:hypothetical protein
MIRGCCPPQLSFVLLSFRSFHIHNAPKKQLVIHIVQRIPQLRSSSVARTSAREQLS